MRIMLIEPPFHSFMQYDRWYYPGALAQLASMVHAEGHEVVIYDPDKYFYKDPLNKQRSIFLQKQSLYYDNVDNFDHEVWIHFLKILANYNPDIVGISIYTCKLKSALNTAKLVRYFNQYIKICVGGAHATATPQILISYDDIDAVFTKYADISFPKWISDGCPKGIIEGSFCNNIDIQNIPYARRQSLLFPDNYTKKDLGLLMAGRGCSGCCTFCSNSFMCSGKPKLRSTESISAELTELSDLWNCSFILIGNDSISDNIDVSKKIASMIHERDMSWEGNARWTTVEKDLFEYYLLNGCSRISIGLESGSNKILKYIRKGVNKNLIRRKSSILNELGIHWRLFCVVGFPIETIDDMRETMDFVLELNPTSVSLNSLAPLPGTEVYSDIPGMTLEIASNVNQLYAKYCFSKHMDLDEFKEMFIKMTEVFDRNINNVVGKSYEPDLK